MAQEISAQLNTEERLFLSLLADAVHGRNCFDPVQVDWQAVFSLARKHHVLPMIVEAAYACPGLPGALLGQAQAASMSIVIRQTLRTRAFLALYEKLRSAGHEPVVVKGAICRSFYPQPDQRPSGDEDLLIDPAELQAVHAFLLSAGLTTDTPELLAEPVHEITYTDGEALRIELHTSLFPPDSRAYGDLNALFSGALARTVTVPIEGTPIRTLASTDHLLYLICHAYKHFLHAGVGIRQICDMERMASVFAKEIDWGIIFESCRRNNMEVFAAALFRIGEKYLGFASPEVFASIETDEAMLLNDILSAGVYVTSDNMDRVHSSTITLEAVAAQRQCRQSRGALSSLFPSRAYMERHFRYVKKHPWLLPLAWAQRIWNYLTHRSGERSVSPAESVRIGNRRVQLLKEYGILR